MHNLIIFILILFSSTLLIQSSVEGKSNNGFSFDIFHRDSKISPLYDRSMTPSELLKMAVLDSRTRVNLFKAFVHNSSKDFVSEITANKGSYLTKLSLGSPKVEVLASISTGSSFMWVQCKACKKCFKDEEPIYKPTTSATYRKVLYHTATCRALRHSHVGDGGICEYTYLYQDGTHTSGVLSDDYFSMKSTTDQEVRISMAFGCSEAIAGRSAKRVQGMVGLGNGKFSLISQLENYIQNKFSYCLLPSTSETSSKLVLGQEATISGDAVVSTPLILDDESSLYFVSLEGVTVGDQSRNTPQDPIKIAIDSGTTLTLLHSSIYDDLEKHVKAVIDTDPIVDPPGRVLNLCYKQLSAINFLEITFHFGGADVRLRSENIFQKYEDMYCMMIERDDRWSVFGNVAQVNFQVEFNYDEQKVSFVRADCANLS